MSRADCFDVVPAKKSREVIPMMIKDFNKREEQGFQRRAQQRIIQIDIKDDDTVYMTGSVGYVADMSVAESFFS